METYGKQYIQFLNWSNIQYHQAIFHDFQIISILKEYEADDMIDWLQVNEKELKRSLFTGIWDGDEFVLVVKFTDFDTHDYLYDLTHIDKFRVSRSEQLGQEVFRFDFDQYNLESIVK